MQRFIVAEVSKTWTIETPIAELLSQKFELVIRTSLSRGYHLSDWKLSQVVNGESLTETIVAIFEHVKYITKTP